MPERGSKRKNSCSQNPPINTQNNFQPLEIEENDDDRQTKKNTVRQTRTNNLPPPIFVPEVKDMKPLLNHLNKVAPKDYYIKYVNKVM